MRGIHVQNTAVEAWHLPAIDTAWDDVETTLDKRPWVHNVKSCFSKEIQMFNKLFAIPKWGWIVLEKPFPGYDEKTRGIS